MIGEKPLLVVMGASGSGKSTVGKLLAERLGLRFVDGDDLHPQVNVDKMAAGHPLDDADREPWLRIVGAELAAAGSSGLVVACSALKRAYRDILRAEAPETRFVYLEAERELLAERIGHRRGHFMPAILLDSQLGTLEPLAGDEPGVTVRLEPEWTPAETADRSARALG